MVSRLRRARETCKGRAVLLYQEHVPRAPCLTVRQEQRRISNAPNLRSRSRTDRLDRNDHAVSQIDVFVLVAVNILIENHAFFFSVVDLVGLAPARRLDLLGGHTNARIAAALTIRFERIGIGDVSLQLGCLDEARAAVVEGDVVIGIR
jgi:hypothetical protein